MFYRALENKDKQAESEQTETTESTEPTDDAGGESAGEAKSLKCEELVLTCSTYYLYL